MEIKVNPDDLINQLLKQIQQLSLEIAALRSVMNQNLADDPAICPTDKQT